MKRFVIDQKRGEHLSYTNIINIDEDDHGDWCRYEDVRRHIVEVEFDNRNYWINVTNEAQKNALKCIDTWRTNAFVSAALFYIMFVAYILK